MKFAFFVYFILFEVCLNICSDFLTMIFQDAVFAMNGVSASIERLQATLNDN